MGLKPPDPPDDYGPGLNCTSCYEPGKTPNYVFVRFWGIVACAARPNPPNGYTFVCAQDPLHPCWFTGQLDFRGHTWEAFFQLSVMGPGGIQSFLELTIPGSGWNAFFACDGAECDRAFDTPYTVCPGWSGSGGIGAVLVFSAAIIIGLTSHYHFVTSPKTRYENFEVGIDHSVFRLANHTGPSNCLFLIEHEEFVIMPPDHPGHF